MLFTGKVATFRWLISMAMLNLAQCIYGPWTFLDIGLVQIIQVSPSHGVMDYHISYDFVLKSSGWWYTYPSEKD